MYLICCSNIAAFAVDEPASGFLAKIKNVAAEAAKADKSALEGKDGLLFFAPELRTLHVGHS